MMSGRLCASSTNCAARWHWDVEEACKHYTQKEVEKQDGEDEDGKRNVEEREKGVGENRGDNFENTETSGCDETSGNAETSGLEFETTEFELGANDKSKRSTAGRPVSLLNKIGLSDLLDKWPKDCIPMGGHVGKLTKS